MARIKAFFKSKRGWLAVLLSLAPLWKTIYNAIDAWGNFLTMKEWLPSILQFFGSTFGTYVVMGSGLVLGGWQLIRQQHKQEEDKVPSSPEVQKAELVPANGNRSSEIPIDHTELEVKFSDRGHYAGGGGGEIRYRLGVYNRGTRVAHRVEVLLEGILPWEHTQSFSSQLPHRLRTRDGKKIYCDISPEREELFEFITSWWSSEFEFKIDGIDPGYSLKLRSYAGVDDRWHFYLKVYCANAKPQGVIFYAYPEERLVRLWHID